MAHRPQSTVSVVRVSVLVRGTVLMTLACVLAAMPAFAQGKTAPQFQTFVKDQAKHSRANDAAPKSADEWRAVREQLRANLLKSWGGFPESPCDLEPRSIGQLDREGYRIEKLTFQTLPGIWMTANAYVPVAAKSKVPAVLCVHGHWAGAKQDPVVQARCIGLVKLGFFVLCVDAFGAGERAVEKKLGQYHGEMTGAMLLPIGKPLSGIQVYENMRAVDYLRSRSEVDPDLIGITGASGGGNQSMYAGAFDERLRCVVPTCSVGNYQAYLSAACCKCEVVPGALRFTEEGNVLGLAAGRGLMVTSATQDAFQFSVDQATISVARADAVAGLLEPKGRASVKHTIIESPHHYNQPMREAMYGWMTLHLKGEGDGSPIAEPSMQTEEPETLRCFPGDSRPDDYVTLPKFAFVEATRVLKERRNGPDRRLLESLNAAKSGSERAAVMAPIVEMLATTVGGMPNPSPMKLLTSDVRPNKSADISFETEPGLELFARCDAAPKSAGGESTAGSKADKIAIVIDIEAGSEKVFDGDHAKRLRSEGWTIVAPELRATGRFAIPGDKIGNAPDHNSAEWSLWIGRPLLGQWACDLRSTLNAVEAHYGLLPKEVAIVGFNSSGVIALTAAALDKRVSHVMAFDSLATFVSDQPYRGQRLGLMVPGLLRDVGDVGHIAALIAPRRVTIYGGVNATSGQLSLQSLQGCYSVTAAAFSASKVPENLQIKSAM